MRVCHLARSETFPDRRLLSSLQNNYFRITAFNRFQAVIQFLRKELNWKQSDALVSCNASLFRACMSLGEY